MDNLKIFNQLRSVPPEAQKKISGGRLNNMTNISPMWRIKAMTETFGPCGIGWYYDNVEYIYIEGTDGQRVCECSLNLYFKIDKEWSKPIYGTGASFFIAKESKGLYTSDEARKMALTDALSVAMKALGVGADIYMGGTSAEAPNKYEKSSKDTYTIEDLSKYNTWLTGLEDINDMVELAKYYKENASTIEADQKIMNLFSNKKNKLEARM